MFNGTEKMININFKKINKVNYNNYLYDNSIDCKGNWFVWQKSILGKKKAIVQNNEGDLYDINVNSPFQIGNDQLFFLDNHKLKCKKLNTNKTITIADNVEKFIVRTNDILFLTMSEFDGEEWGNKLYLYNLATTKRKILYENVRQFYNHHEKVFVVNTTGMLIQVPIDGASANSVCSLPIEHYTNIVMPQENNLVFTHINKLILFDIDTKKSQKVQLSDGDYANNKIIYICDDKNIFVSFQATKTNGSIVTDIDTTENGLWSIDPNSLKKEKISSYSFEKLYLFENTLLFGTQGNTLFQIDVASKQVIPLT